jgi:hypothetical protein
MVYQGLEGRLAYCVRFYGMSICAWSCQIPMRDEVSAMADFLSWPVLGLSGRSNIWRERPLYTKFRTPSILEILDSGDKETPAEERCGRRWPKGVRPQKVNSNYFGRVMLARLHADR